jgi:hypothetical protein
MTAKRRVRNGRVRAAERLDTLSGTAVMILPNRRTMTHIEKDAGILIVNVRPRGMYIVLTDRRILFSTETSPQAADRAGTS